jgi:hypothetical protein
VELLLARTNPLEDLGRLLARPLRFCASLATDESAVSGWAISKALGFYLFATALVSIAFLAPEATLAADVLGFISDKLRPFYDALGLSSRDVTAFESLAFFGVKLAGEIMVFTHLLKAFCGMLLFAALLSLVWPHWGFRRVLCWAAYSHWFVILGLLSGSEIIVGVIASLYLARITLEAEGRVGFWNLLNRWTLVGLLSLVVSLAGLSLT